MYKLSSIVTDILAWIGGNFVVLICQVKQYCRE